MPLPADADFLSAALVGYHQKLQEIDARMADLCQQLGGSSPAPAPGAAARRRMAAAQRKRWTAARKAKAEEATTPAPAKADKKERRLSPEAMGGREEGQGQSGGETGSAEESDAGGGHTGPEACCLGRRCQKSKTSDRATKDGCPDEGGAKATGRGKGARP